jgi:hypothetical protein
MNLDISGLLAGWQFVPGELSVRRIERDDRGPCIQVRMDLGLMQLEWAGRPDATRPHGFDSLLDYYLDARERWDRDRQEPFTLSRDACHQLSLEAMKYYWRRVSFFELKEYAKAELDAVHNLAILDLCEQYAEVEEDRQMADHHRSFVLAHWAQARALGCLERRDHSGALAQIREGIQRVETHLRNMGRFDQLDDLAELRFLREWEKEVDGARPRTAHEQLSSELRRAVEQEQFELAAALRDRLQCLECEQPVRLAAAPLPSPGRGE